MSIAIYVLEQSIADFAGSVAAVAPDGTAIYFDAPHLHASADKDESSQRERRKKIFFLGGASADPAGKDFQKTLEGIRAALKKLAVPMVSTKAIVNSDGISVRQYIVYKSAKVDVLIPRIFSGLELGSPDVARCGEKSHVVMRSLGYRHCPVDGTELSKVEGAGIFHTFLRDKFRISEVRVEEPTARKACEQHREDRFPNLFARCPLCGAPLVVAKKLAPPP